MTHSTTRSAQTSRGHLSPLTASIHLSRLAHNVAEIRRSISPACAILAVVKADAYGHGASRISQTLAQLGIQQFGVATVQEGVQLRQQGITQPILVMGGLHPSQLTELVHHQLMPVISDEETAYQLTEHLGTHQTPYPVHIKIDTGMRRLGFSQDAVIPFLQSTLIGQRLEVEGLMTHLADADNRDPTFTHNQLEQFQAVVSQLKEAGLSIPRLHAANSAAIMTHRLAHLDMVRPGIMLYGYPSDSHSLSSVMLQPIMNVATHIVHIRSVGPGESIGYNRSYRTTRSTRLAVIPVGYAHGYPRLLSNRGMVLINGCRAPIVGKICMDMTLVDITDIHHVYPGHEVVLLGEQGMGNISAEEIAGWAETISYDILCALGGRATRIYEPLQAPMER